MAGSGEGSKKNGSVENNAGKKIEKKGSYVGKVVAHYFKDWHFLLLFNFNVLPKNCRRKERS